MELTVKATDLAQVLRLIQPVTDKKATIPILGSVLLSANQHGLTVSGTNLDLAAICRCPAAVKTPGTAAIPIQRAAEYVAMLPKADVQLKLKSDWLSFACNRSRSRIAGLSAKSFPELPKPPERSLTVSTGILARLIEKVSFAVSSEESRYTLTGALLKIDRSGFTMVATDGHRLSLAEHRVEIDGMDATAMQAIVAKKTLHEFLRFSEGRNDQSVECAFSDNHLFFVWQDRLLVSGKLSGNFPDYARALPEQHTDSIQLNRDEFHASLERVTRFGDNKMRAVVLEISNGQLSLRGMQTDIAESEEALPVSYGGSTKKIVFNAAYMIDFLKRTEHKSVQFFFRDEKSSAELRPETEDAGILHRYVLMPLYRTNQ